MKEKGLLILVLVFICSQLLAQDPSRQTKLKLLSKEWLLQKTETEGKLLLPSTTMPRFRLVLHENEKCEQGIPPDGMISSTWTLSADLNEITFYDSNPKIKQTYTARIILINTSQLVLSINTNNHLSNLYYTLE